MEKSKSGTLASGLGLLLEEASCTTDLHGFHYGRLGKHPFGFKVPTAVGESGARGLYDVAFIGIPDSNEGIYCLARLIGWRMGCRHAFLVPGRPSFLRILSAKTGHQFSQENFVYYEVGMGTDLYITGGRTGYAPGDSPFEQLFSVLSHIYQVPIYKHEIARSDFLVYRERFNKDLSRAWDEEYHYRQEWFDEVKRYRNFKPGDKLTWNPDIRDDEMPKWCARGGRELIAAEVETIPSECSCGIGNYSPIFLHRLDKCNLRRIHENAHNQMVTVKWGEKTETLTGWHFDTNKL